MHIFCVVPKRLFFSEVLKNKARLKLFPACTVLDFIMSVEFLLKYFIPHMYCTVLPNFQIVSVLYGKIKINVIRKVIKIQFHSISHYQNKFF